MICLYFSSVGFIPSGLAPLEFFFCDDTLIDKKVDAN